MFDYTNCKGKASTVECRIREPASFAAALLVKEDGILVYRPGAVPAEIYKPIMKLVRLLCPHARLGGEKLGTSRAEATVLQLIQHLESKGIEAHETPEDDAEAKKTGTAANEDSASKLLDGLERLMTSHMEQSAKTMENHIEKITKLDQDKQARYDRELSRMKKATLGGAGSVLAGTPGLGFSPGAVAGSGGVIPASYGGAWSPTTPSPLGFGALPPGSMTPAGPSPGGAAAAATAPTKSKRGLASMLKLKKKGVIRKTKKSGADAGAGLFGGGDSSSDVSSASAPAGLFATGVGADDESEDSDMTDQEMSEQLQEQRAALQAQHAWLQRQQQEFEEQKKMASEQYEQAKRQLTSESGEAAQELRAARDSLLAAQTEQQAQYELLQEELGSARHFRHEEEQEAMLRGRRNEQNAQMQKRQVMLDKLKNLKAKQSAEASGRFWTPEKMKEHDRDFDETEPFKHVHPMLFRNPPAGKMVANVSDGDYEEWIAHAFSPEVMDKAEEVLPIVVQLWKEYQQPGLRAVLALKTFGVSYVNARNSKQPLMILLAVVVAFIELKGGEGTSSASSGSG